MADLRDISPAKQAEVVTKSDATTLEPTRALYVGTGGDLAVVMKDGGGAKTFANVPSGSVLAICVTKVMSTNTDAADILALY